MIAECRYLVDSGAGTGGRFRCVDRQLLREVIVMWDVITVESDLPLQIIFLSFFEVFFSVCHFRVVNRKLDSSICEVLWKPLSWPIQHGPWNHEIAGFRFANPSKSWCSNSFSLERFAFSWERESICFMRIKRTRDFWVVDCRSERWTAGRVGKEPGHWETKPRSASSSVWVGRWSWNQTTSLDWYRASCYSGCFSCCF